MLWIWRGRRPYMWPVHGVKNKLWRLLACWGASCGAGSVLQLHGASWKLYKSLRKALLQYSASIHAADQCQRLGKRFIVWPGQSIWSNHTTVFEALRDWSFYWADVSTKPKYCQVLAYRILFIAPFEVETHLFMRPMRVEMCMQSFSWQLRRVQLHVFHKV